MYTITVVSAIMAILLPIGFVIRSSPYLVVSINKAQGLLLDKNGNLQVITKDRNIVIHFN